MSFCACSLPTVEPCSRNCSCHNQILSGGCSRCATYGSDEQRIEMAQMIAARERTARELFEAGREYRSISIEYAEAWDVITQDLHNKMATVVNRVDNALAAAREAWGWKD